MPHVAPAVTLRTLLATYPNTAALKQGRVRSPAVEFDFADVKAAHSAFKSLVRDEAFDAGELAIVTYLQAKASGTPYVLVPAVIVARAQHQAIVYNADRGTLTPRDLEGRRVGVRAYTQTTGAWVRGILEDEYGVDFTRVRWVTFEEPHVADYVDPAWVERAPPGKDLLQMLVDGEIDAAIFGNETPGPPIAPLIPDAGVAATAWSDRRGLVPVNHMLVVRQSIARDRPEVVREVYRLLDESRHAAPAGSVGDTIRFGVEANRPALEAIVGYAVRQHLIPRRFSVDELFDDTTRALGVR